MYERGHGHCSGGQETDVSDGSLMNRILPLVSVAGSDLLTRMGHWSHCLDSESSRHELGTGAKVCDEHLLRCSVVLETANHT